MTLEQVERHMIAQGMEQHGGNISRVAQARLSRTALYRACRHGIGAGDRMNLRWRLGAYIALLPRFTVVPSAPDVLFVAVTVADRQPGGGFSLIRRASPAGIYRTLRPAARPGLCGHDHSTQPELMS